MSGRILGRLLLGVALVAALAAVLCRVPQGVETDLYALADAGAGDSLRPVARSLAGKARILLSGTNTAALVSAAKAACRQLERPIPNPSSFQEVLRTRSAGLLSPVTRMHLLSGDTRTVRDGAVARLYGLVPPLVSLRSDPFLLATDYATSLTDRLVPGWQLVEGFPVKAEGTIAHLLVAVDVSGLSATRLRTFLETFAAHPPPGVVCHCAGAPFHAALATAHAQREITILSVVSLVLVLVLGWRLFGDLAFAGPLVLALGAGSLVAAGALFAAYPRPHVLTFVFGTSLVGLAVDYVYHVRRAGGFASVRRPLAYALVTTLASLVPLAFSEVTVLRQMALFTAAGLMGTFAWVALVPLGNGGRGVKPQAEAGSAANGVPVFWAVLVLMVTLPGIGRLRLVSDPAVFYRPDAVLLEGEGKLAEVGGSGTGRFVFVPGAGVQEALEREEAAGVKGLSAIVPSLRRQRENLALVRRLFAAEGVAYAHVTGFKRLVAPAEDAPLLDPFQLPPGTPVRTMAETMWTGSGLVSPLRPGDVAPDAPGVRVIAPREAVQALFSSFTASALRLAAWAVGGVLVLLLALFRRRALTYAAPVVAALGATAGTLGWCGVPVTFFTVLCLFVLMGLGIDYVIFNRTRATRAVRRTVRYAFLTSLAGLGMLAFTAFPVTRMMGIAFAVGLVYAWLFAQVSTRRGPSGARQDWFRQPEQSAGAWRLRFLWGVYVLFGKRVLKLAVVPVMAFIYPFARPARAALDEFHAVLAGGRKAWWWQRHVRDFRHLLGFAQALVDKVDVCTLHRAPPYVTVRDDADARTFRKLADAGRGAFLLATHLGTVEVLPALQTPPGGRRPRVHAFQQLSHNAVFTALFLRHFDASAFVLHDVASIGVETAVELEAAMHAGDCVLMAGDRPSAGSARTLAYGFLGRPCRWPRGVFALARMLGAPVFFVTCVRTASESYEVHFRAAPPQPFSLAALLAAYVAFLEEETRAHPDQWYHFHRFF